MASLTLVTGSEQNRESDDMMTTTLEIDLVFFGVWWKN